MIGDAVRVLRKHLADAKRRRALCVQRRIDRLVVLCGIGRFRRFLRAIRRFVRDRRRILRVRRTVLTVSERSVRAARVRHVLIRDLGHGDAIDLVAVRIVQIQGFAVPADAEIDANVRILRRAIFVAAEHNEVSACRNDAGKICVVIVALLVAECKTVDRNVRPGRIVQLHPVAFEASAARKQRVARGYLADFKPLDRFGRILLRINRIRLAGCDRRVVRFSGRRFGCVPEGSVAASRIGNVPVQRGDRHLTDDLKVCIDQYKILPRRLQRKTEADRTCSVPRQRIGLFLLGGKQNEISVRRKNDLRKPAGLVFVFDVVGNAPAQKVDLVTGLIVQLDPVRRTVPLVFIARSVAEHDFADHDGLRGVVRAACAKRARHAEGEKK